MLVSPLRRAWHENEDLSMPEASTCVAIASVLKKEIRSEREALFTGPYVHRRPKCSEDFREPPDNNNNQ
jgi:hypothetical protein